MMLMHAVVSGLIFIKRRRMTQVIPWSWRKLWKEWELRGLILLSLTTQILLIFMGNRRKYIAGTWARILVWSAYLVADSLALMALGILSNDLGELYDDGGDLDTNKELTAFWAPLLLLHLGGTDSITAYALEDNELWTRQSFGVISQGVGTLYILLMAWTGSRISILFIPMFFVGLIKYLERVWVLYSSSEMKFEDSISHKEMESKSFNLSDLNKEEGSKSDADSLVIAYGLLDMVKAVFADYRLTDGDRKASRSLFTDASMCYQKAFKIVEIELGFMYDLLYTKANVIYSYQGIVQRIICICLTFTVLVVFSFSWAYSKYFTEKLHDSKVDVSITFILLAVALFLELFAFVQLIFSDQTTCWLIKHRKTTFLRAISHLRPLFRRPRWSNSMGQYNLLSFSLREKPLPFHGILNKLPFYEMLETRQYDTSVPVPDNFKKFIFQEVKSSLESQEVNLTVFNPTVFFRRRDGPEFKRLITDVSGVKLDFNVSIVVWHFVTEICYYHDRGSINERLEHSKLISEYMVYLLVKHPNTLPIRMAQVRFAEICAEVRNFIKDTSNRQEACEKLHRGEVERTIVLSRAHKIASELLRPNYINEEWRWKIIMYNWLEMLGYAAYECGGRKHAKKLRQGGELLTHFRLLMVHFGLSEHCTSLTDLFWRFIKA